jgi:hypothetical protein
VSREVTLEADQTVLMLRHTSNIGYPGALDLTSQSPHWPLLSRLEHAGRMRTLIDTHIAPLMEAVRSVGVRILYIMDGWAACEQYPQWQALRARVPEVPDLNVGIRCPDTAWRDTFESRVFMPGYRQAVDKMNRDIKVAPPLAPEPDDWIASTDRQVRTLLNENGVWNVLHAGFDINDGVLYSPVAGLYWFGRTYRCILLRDCVTGEEPADTECGEGLRNTIVDFMERCGYAALGADIRRGLPASAHGSGCHQDTSEAERA